MSDAIPIHGTCDSRFEGVRKIFEQNFASGTDLGSAVCFTLDGETVVDLWGGYVLNKSQTAITGAINAFAMIGAFFEAL